MLIKGLQSRNCGWLEFLDLSNADACRPVSGLAHGVYETLLVQPRDLRVHICYLNVRRIE